MTILQIAAVGICVVFLGVMFKTYNGTIGMYIIFAGSILICFYSTEKLMVVFSAVEEIQSYIKINTTYLNSLIKIIGITYVAEFASSICKDAGYMAIASQIEVFGKLSILAISMPVILALLSTVEGLLGITGG